MASEEQETTDRSEASTPESDDSKTTSNVLVDTTTVRVDGIDQQIVAAVKAGDLDIEDIVQAQRVAEGQVDPTELEAPVPEEEDVLTTAHEQPPENEKSSDATGETDSEVGDSTGNETAAGDTTDGSDKSSDSGAEPSESSPVATSSDTDDDTTAMVDGEITDPSTNTEMKPASDTDPDTVELTLSPLTVALATVASDGTEYETSEEFVAVAVREYLRGLLEETVTEPDSPPDEILVKGGASLNLALKTVVGQTDDFEDISELLTISLADAIAPESDSETTLAIPGLTPYLPLVDAIVKNDRHPVMSRAEVVAVAVRHRVAEL